MAASAGAEPRGVLGGCGMTEGADAQCIRTGWVSAVPGWGRSAAEAVGGRRRVPKSWEVEKPVRFGGGWR